MSIPRIIFNFNDQCFNQCPFCFIPFDHRGAGDLQLWQNILERAHSFSPTLISFSGCDPFLYPDFYKLLQSVPKKCKWAVDASLVYLDKEAFARVSPLLDLISTSLDDTPDMPLRQRYPDEKLAKFYDNFDFVRQRCPQIMVHTLYSQRNAPYLTDIADFLIDRRIKHWSMYQFWPFDFISEKAAEFVTADDIFLQEGERLSRYCGDKIDFEAVPYKGRANGYFFVSSLGTVYTVLPGDTGRYYTIGSIFDADIEGKWRACSTPEKAEAILKRKLQREEI